MRIKYIGRDNRARVANANRFKFIPDGFQRTDPRYERDENIQGPIVIFHTNRINGGKRTILAVPSDFDFDAAQRQLLENGWIDLSMFPSISESQY